MRQRMHRVSEAIKEELSDLIRNEMKDPRVGFVSIVSVDVSRDLRHARIFVSVYGDPEEQKETLVALEWAKGFLRTELGQRVRLRFTPEIQFELDTSIAHGDKINRLLHRLHDEEAAEKGERE